MSTPDERKLQPEVLTDAEARERRRQARRATRQAMEDEKATGIRLLKKSIRHLERGRPDKATTTILSGFGGIMLAGLLRKLQGKD